MSYYLKERQWEEKNMECRPNKVEYICEDHHLVDKVGLQLGPGPNFSLDQKSSGIDIESFHWAALITITYSPSQVMKCIGQEKLNEIATVNIP